MRFRTSDGYIVERTLRRIYPRVLWTDRDLTFHDHLGWPADDAGEKLDGEFLTETPFEAATRRIESVLAILDDWDERITDMGGDEEDMAAKNVSKSSGRSAHLRRALKGLFDDLAERPRLDPRAVR